MDQTKMLQNYQQFGHLGLDDQKKKVEKVEKKKCEKKKKWWFLNRSSQ